MKTIGNIIHHNSIALKIYDDAMLIYYEDSVGYWVKQKFDSKGKLLYSENSNGILFDNIT